MAGSMRAARNETPERSPMVQGWATSPETLTGAPWRMAEDGTPGDLDRDQVGAVLAHDQELGDVERLAVLVGLGSAGLEVDHRLGRHRAQERDRRCVDRELHWLPPSLGTLTELCHTYGTPSRFGFRSHGTTRPHRQPDHSGVTQRSIKFERRNAGK